MFNYFTYFNSNVFIMINTTVVTIIIMIAAQALCHESVDFQEVRFPKLKYNLRAQNSPTLFSLLESKPLHIIFEGVNPVTVQCSYKNITMNFRDNFCYNGTCIIKIERVTKYMSGKWKCSLYDFKTTTYSFEIRVKAAKMVSATIDGLSLNFSLTNEKIQEYDGVYEYLCEEGIKIDLTCINPYDDGSLVLRYYNANGTIIIESDEEKQPKVPLDFRLLMKAEVNKSYVDCTYFTAADHGVDRPQEFTYRVIFISTNDVFKNDYFTVNVNDMKLISKPSKAKFFDKYSYRFIYGENLTITCKKNKQIPDDDHEILMGTDKNYKYWNIEESQYMYRRLVETKHLDNATIDCSTYDPNINEMPRAMINFYKQSYDDPAILGLSGNDLLYEYSKNSREWIAHYQYTPKETRILTCTTITDKALRWYEGKKMVTGTVGIDRSIGIRYIRDSFTLNLVSITCELVGTGKSRKFLFHKKPRLTTDDHELPVPDKASDETSNLAVIIGSVAGILLALLITAMCMFYWCRWHKTGCRKERPHIQRRISRRNNDEYTYITNEYNYIVNEERVNSLYCGSITDNIVPSRNTTCSGHTENHYTEIDNYFAKETDDKLKNYNVGTYDSNEYKNFKCRSDPS